MVEESKKSQTLSEAEGPSEARSPEAFQAQVEFKTDDSRTDLHPWRQPHGDSTETHRRSGFLMHGDSKPHPGSASNGCIVLPELGGKRSGKAATEIWKSLQRLQCSNRD